MNELELQIHRENTAAFIAEDPLVIQLQRYVRARTASGGVTTTLAATQPSEQVFRLIPQQSAPADTMTSDGTVAPITYVLLGAWDADVNKWDRFSMDGVEYELAGEVWPLHSSESVYERKVPVVRRGK